MGTGARSKAKLPGKGGEDIQLAKKTKEYNIGEIAERAII